MTHHVLTLGAPQPEAVTVTVLQQAQAALDELAGRQAGGLAVIPASTGSIAAAEYHGITYVAWPRTDYERINREWQKVAAFGSKSPFGSNTEIADLITAGWFDRYPLQVISRLSVAVTVDQARTAIRNLLRTLPAPKPLAPAAPPAQSPAQPPVAEPPVTLPPPPPITFPQHAPSKKLWWILGSGGAVAAGAIIFLLITSKKRPVSSSSPVAGALRRTRPASIKAKLASIKELLQVEDAWQEEDDSFFVKYRAGWTGAEGTRHDTAESLTELMKRARGAERE